MMKKTSLVSVALLTASVFAGWDAQAEAQWEEILPLPTAQGFLVAENGNLLASTYRRDGQGGIYVSTDKGATWERNTTVADRDFYRFVEIDDAIYALGYQCYIAVSHDGGLNWEEINYYPYLEEVVPKGQYAGACYAAAKHGDRLYFAEFNGAVFYTDDDCETFHITDRESMMVDAYGDLYPDAIYNLVSFNGKLYAFGLYVVWSYDEEADHWECDRADSNCMSVSTLVGDKLVTGRAMTNYSTDVPLIMSLDAEGNWSDLPRPEFTDDNNARALASKDGKIFVGLSMGGFLYTPDMGESWYNISEGFPQFAPSFFMVPCAAQCDDDYLYAAVYWSNATDERSGVYRLPLAELPGTTGVESVNASGTEVVLSVSQGTVVSSDGSAVEVYDAQGRRVANGSLAPGLYIARSGEKAAKIIIRD